MLASLASLHADSPPPSDQPLTAADLAAPDLADMRASGPPLTGNVEEGGEVIQQVRFEAGKCYVLVAASRGIDDLKSEITTDRGVAGPQVPSIERRTLQGSLAEGLCTSPLMNEMGEWTLTAIRGHGRVLGQVFVND